MSKKYHLTPDQAAFVHLINSAFAGIDFSIDLAVNPPAGVKKISKKALIEAIKATLAQTNQALTSEYIRGELVKEGILEDGQWNILHRAFEGDLEWRGMEAQSEAEHIKQLWRSAYA